MCHRKFIMKPSRLTLIYGRNGSGKSAILEAIHLAFGGLGRERQELLRDFIRYGKTRSLIRLKLNNSVALPGIGVIYLDPKLRQNSEVIIERIIKPELTIYKINGQKATKEEVVTLLSKVNISPKNPFFFVPQEKITKLLEMKPEERLDAIMAGLGLLELKRALSKLKDEIRGYEKRKSEIKREIEELQKNLEEQKKVLASVESAIQTLKNYYVYKLALLYKKRLRYLEEEEELLKKIDELEKRIKDHENFINTLPDKLANISKEIGQMQEEKAKIIAEDPELDRKIRELEEREKELSLKIKNLDSKRANILEKMETILKKWRVSTLEDMESLLKSNEERLVKLEELIEKADETRQIRELEKTLNIKKKELKELERIRVEYIKKFEEIMNLLDPSGNVLKVYNFVVKEGLTDEVQGPLILEIAFNIDNTKLKQYAYAIERALDRKILKSFVALSWRALRKLMVIIKRLGRDPPTVFFFGHGRGMWSGEHQFAHFLYAVPEEIFDKFEERRIKIMEKLSSLSSYERSAFICLLPQLIDAPQATKAIIEYFAGSTALVSNLDAGISLMRNIELDRIVTIDGEVVQRYPVGEGAIYSMLPKIENPTENPEESLIYRAREFKMQEFRRKKRDLDDAISNLRDEIRNLERQISILENNLPTKIRNLWLERSKLKDAISELRHDILYLVTAYKERNRLPEQIRKLESQLDKIEKQIVDLCKKKDLYAKRLVEIDSKIGQFEKYKETLISQKGKIMAELEKMREDVTILKSKVETIRRFKNSIEGEIDSLKREIRALTLVVWSTLSSNREHNVNDVLEKEIVEPAALIIKEMSESELEEIIKNFDEKGIADLRFDIISREEKIRAIEQIRSKLEKHKAELNTIERSIESARRLAEKTLNRLLARLREKIRELSENYKYVLSKIGAKGDVQLVGDKIDQMCLKITIDLHRNKPVDISEGAFSSGEKTLAIFAFIIALFLTSPTPILILDEFDVYLDDLMVALAAKILKEVLLDLKYVQCILTTTHRVELMRVADVIINLVYDESAKSTTSYVVPKRRIEKIVSRGSIASIQP